MFELVENYTPSAEIKVIGVGGGGGNAVSQMIDASIDGVEFIAANTDAQALRQFKGRTLLQIGSSVTKGLGAGANPEVGRQAALEDRDRIIEMIDGADMVFITAGMGGGTGTGAAPVIAQAAKELGILTVAVVTKPFHFEAKRRMTIAEQGIEELSKHVDSLITIPNSKLPEVMGSDALLLNAFKAANDVLQGAVQGIAELITRQGLINVDFADVRTVMSEMGMAVMGAGQAKGEDRAIMAVQSAIGSPLLEDVNLQGACGVLVNITAGMNLTMREFEEIGAAVSDLASDDATVVIGTVIDPEIGDELRVTVVATGLGDSQKKRKPVEPVETQIHVVRNATTGQPEPPYMGGQDQYSQDTGEVSEEPSDLFSTPDASIDYLDIPAFLRNQAD
ncbi:MAG: cell division protein FtsZ [Gammaproteobacteria bacterium]|nr:cell division protein FtsZ [Gammaproteobacteria bacterium]